MLKGLNAPSDPDLLVGFDTSDDAAVYRVSPEIALISTVDDIEPKCGLAVTGSVHPERILTNCGQGR